MANNYTVASFMVIADDHEEAQLEKVLGIYEYLLTEELCRVCRLEEIQEELPEELADDKRLIALCVAEAQNYTDYGCLGFDWNREEGDGIWFHADESFNCEIAASCLYVWLAHFDLDYVIEFEFAHTCSKSRVGEFGGGCCVITKGGEHWMNSAAAAMDIRQGLKYDDQSVDRIVAQQGWNKNTVLMLYGQVFAEDPLVRARLMRRLEQVQAEENS